MKQLHQAVAQIASMRLYKLTTHRRYTVAEFNAECAVLAFIYDTPVAKVVAEVDELYDQMLDGRNIAIAELDDDKESDLKNGVSVPYARETRDE
jgi:hypothetical protein